MRAMLLDVSEKRSYQRYPIWFPITLTHPAGEVKAVCRDVSPGGLLVSAVSPLEVGTPVVVRIGVRPEVAAESAIPATVVREAWHEDELLLAFPYRVAVEFASPVDDLLDELTDHVELEP